VDILVAADDLSRAASVLVTQDFLPISSGSADVHALDRDQDTGRFLWIHVQTVLRVAGAVFPAGEVLEAAERSSPPQMAASWLFWTLALRGLVEKRTIPSRHRDHLNALSAQAMAAPDAFLMLARRHGLDPEVVVQLAAAGEWTQLEGLPLNDPRRHRDPRLAALRRVRSWIGARASPHGMTVAVLGPDGAGKTTLVHSLERSLPIATRIQYLGLTGGRMPRADALRVPGVVFAVRLMILWWRYLRGAYHCARGRIVLFERYVLDAAVPSGVRLRPIAKMSRRLQRWVLPLPDLVLLLDASGATMHRRSGEYEPARLEAWRSAFRDLQHSVSQLEVLDAERPADEVLRDAEARIWRRYRALGSTG
jgi:thymidylate kinase